jgi:hypothetical protein
MEKKKKRKRKKTGEVGISNERGGFCFGMRFWG